jgi:hypothetical protein
MEAIMRLIKLIIPILLLFHLPSTLTALERDYKAEEFCASHQKHYSKAKLLGDHLALIPLTSSQCLHVDCPQCHNVYIAYYLHDDGDEALLSRAQKQERTIEGVSLMKWICERKMDNENATYWKKNL